MHGLIFMTWEKYLTERFGSLFLYNYREQIGETVADIPLATRMYDDATLLAGVGAACNLSHVPAETLLREYGRYFILNGLTSHLCSHILSRVNNSRDLLLSMRDSHARMRNTLDTMQPPLFKYRYTPSPNEVIIIYDSPRQLCPVLLGAIEGAAVRYHETVQIQEQCCMKQGAPFCQIKAAFSPSKTDPAQQETPERIQRQAMRETLMKQVWIVLPDIDSAKGLTLAEIQKLLHVYRRIDASQLRPAMLIEALHQLQFSGYVTSTATEPDDELIQRRYWRVQKHL